MKTETSIQTDYIGPDIKQTQFPLSYNFLEFKTRQKRFQYVSIPTKN